MPGKRANRFLRFCLWLLLIAILLVFTTPLWFPWILRPAAKRFGATFQGYTRNGYEGFTAAGVIYTNRNVRVTAGRLEVAPWRGKVRAQDWAVIVTRSNRPRRTNDPSSVHEIYNKVAKIVSDVQRRIPSASLTNGYVQTPKVTIDIPGVQWHGIHLSGQAQISNALPLTTVRAQIPPAGPTVVDLINPTLDLQSRVAASNSADGLVIQSTNRWRTNDFFATALFGREGVLPNAATITAKRVVVPPAVGDISLVWSRDHYVLNLDGAVLKQPISFHARARGDTESAQVDALELTAPWARAELQDRVPVLYKRPFFTNVARFDITADLVRQPWIPATGQLRGQVWVQRNLSHGGSIIVENASVPRLKDFNLALDWSGAEAAIERVQATITARGSAVSATGAADLKARQFQVTELALGTNQVDFAADLHWPKAANLCAQLTNVSVESMRGFVDLSYEQILLEHLRLRAQWDGGPLTANVDFAGRTVLNDGTQLGAAAAAALDSAGLTVTNLTFTRNSEPVAGAHGIVPIAVNPTNKPAILPLADSPMDLQARAHPQAFFWKMLQNRFGITLNEPDTRVDVSGTWKAPKARISARAAALKLRGAAPEVPPIDTLSLLAHVDEKGAQIEFFNFFVTNQPVTFSATMPLPERFWRAPRSNAAQLDWRKLTCRLEIDDAQIAPFAPLLSGLAAPQGVIHANFGLLPGGKLDGELRIDGAGTRPVPALGAFEDIEVLCRFEGENATIHSYLTLGGHSVLGAGKVRVDPNKLARRELPPFEIHFTGENVPLTRQPDAVIRADVAVTAKHLAEQSVTISGNLNLRDSLYLRELRDLVPGKVASADRRPPYFSVEANPFHDWQLNLNVAGQRFLKVRTPIFNGEISADLKLSGTLGDPVATGDLIINEGLIRFPFGTVEVNYGMVSLTSDNPYRPQLQINGNDRVLGYDLTMELTGYADAPVLQFSSTPPLSSEQILLMLTAGEVPRQGQIAFSAEQRAQRVALFLGRGMLADLGLAGDSNRLTIRSGEHVTETGRPTYSVEYELSEDWSVIGQYDRFNDFNLMLKWQVYSK